MDMKNLIKTINEVEMGNKLSIYTHENSEIFIFKPTEIPSHLKRRDNYDPKKNFQIFLNLPNQEPFRPNHLRILLDLYLKKTSDATKADKLFNSFEEIYDKKDPLNFIDDIKDFDFRMQIDNAILNLLSGQLFMVEQEINYTFGKVQPPRAFMMGYIRLIRDTDLEIDKLLWRATRNPPPVGYWRDYKRT